MTPVKSPSRQAGQERLTPDKQCGLGATSRRTVECMILLLDGYIADPSALWDRGRVTLFGKGVQGMPQHYANQFGSVLPPRSVTPPPPPNNSGTIALLQQWAREDVTGDPAKIAEAERELAQFKAALNANRPPDQPVFP